MLRNLTWQATDELIRAQFCLFRDIADEIGLTEAERAQALGLIDAARGAWTDFIVGGPLPADPSMPEMLLRVGHATYTVSIMADMRLRLRELGMSMPLVTGDLLSLSTDHQTVPEGSRRESRPLPKCGMSTTDSISGDPIRTFFRLV